MNVIHHPCLSEVENRKIIDICGYNVSLIKTPEKGVPIFPAKPNALGWHWLQFLPLLYFNTCAILKLDFLLQFNDMPSMT